MNWLAHLHLASLVQADAAGSLLPDMINTHKLDQFTEAQQYAISLHQVIDQFTDQHTIVKTSKRRINPPFNRFAGILIDVFYDYCLCKAWEFYSTISLKEFIASTHQQLQQQPELLPEPAPHIIKHLIEQEWLESYQTLAGIELSLQRISRRFKRPLQLDRAVDDLKISEVDLIEDFKQFYPELIAYTQSLSTGLSFKTPN